MVCKRNLSSECGSESETNPKNLPPRGAPCLQCPRLGAGIFQCDDGTCQHTSGSGWQRMGGRRRDQYVFEPDGKCAWYEDGGSTLVIYALVLPFVFLILRLVPEERAEKMKISFLQFCMFFILAQGFGTIFNLLGNAINDAVAASSGGDASAMNPVNEMLDSLSPVMILYVGFLGPIIEEYIFRWKLLNRLRRFGDKAAITYTALMFV